MVNQLQPTSKAVFREIETCTICQEHKPFHFEMGSQKVMLITTAPIFAAVHRPLYFIPFFRKICLALFGDVDPDEKFIREFYDPSGSIYWTHYQKCYKSQETGISHSCEPLLRKEVNILDPDLILILEHSKISHLKDRNYIGTRPDGRQRKVLLADFPCSENEKEFVEIRKILQEYIPWIQVESGSLDFSAVHFIDLEFASIESLQDHEKGAGAPVPINAFEYKWMKGIILPNLKAYNLVLQTFIFIESNIKNLLESKLDNRESIEKRWFSPFENMMYREFQNDYQKQKFVRNLMIDIDSLYMIRNIIAHSSGVIDEQHFDMSRLDRIKRLRGVYIYGGNSLFISSQGVENIFKICNRFREMYGSVFQTEE